VNVGIFCIWKYNTNVISFLQFCLVRSLTALTSFSHLLNLENLDISRNNIDSLRRKASGFSQCMSCDSKILLICYVELECLRHLRELKADHNKITSLDGLQNMDGLVKLSVQNNLMQSVELGKFKWFVTQT